MISQLPLKAGEGWEGSWNHGSSISSVDGAPFQAREVGWVRPRFFFQAQSPFSPRGWLHEVGVFSPGRVVRGPVFISHLTLLGTSPSSGIY